MILMDVDMPDMNGYEAVGRLKKNDAFKQIPIVFLSSRADATSETFGLNMGALDYIHKPIVSELLLRRLEMHLSVIEYQKMLEEQSKANEKTEAVVLLDNIIGTLESAAAVDDTEKIKSCLARALDESKQLLAVITPKKTAD
jgi:putative two-component system response regulator